MIYLFFFLFDPSGQYLHLVFWSDEYLEFLKWTKLPVSSQTLPSLFLHFHLFPTFPFFFFLFARSFPHIQNSTHHIFHCTLISFLPELHTRNCVSECHLRLRHFIASHALNLFFLFTSKPLCQNQGKPITLWSHYSLILAGHSANGTASKRRNLIVFSRMIAAADSLLIEANFLIVCALIQ